MKKSIFNSITVNNSNNLVLTEFIDLQSKYPSRETIPL
jgi:hypothetical protein